MGFLASGAATLLVVVIVEFGPSLMALVQSALRARSGARHATYSHHSLLAPRQHETTSRSQTLERLEQQHERPKYLH
jgi:hypothetical protein